MKFLSDSSKIKELSVFSKDSVIEWSKILYEYLNFFDFCFFNMQWKLIKSVQTEKNKSIIQQSLIKAFLYFVFQSIFLFQFFLIHTYSRTLQLIVILTYLV